MSAALPFTIDQRKAIETAGQSVIVSAAAGSGKTAVLAQRCAHLVCQAKPPCDVDSLLVLTFTEAAAAEMRTRIIEAIRQQVMGAPQDERLQSQLTRMDQAQISTIHAFCLWMIRRWFNEAGIDPNASVMDQQEASLLRRETIKELITGLYETSRVEGLPLGKVSEAAPSMAPTIGAENTDKNCDLSLALSFTQLVDDYGLGDDSSIIGVVLKLSDFLTSLPDPQGWLDEATSQPDSQPEEIVRLRMKDLQNELARQGEHCENLATALQQGDPVGHFYGQGIDDYGQQVTQWQETLDGILGEQDLSRSLKRYDQMLDTLKNFTFEKKSAPRLSKDTPEEKKILRTRASKLYSTVKKKLLGERVRDSYALFTVNEAIDALRQTAPYVNTLCQLTTSFRSLYQQKKRQRSVLDFADLERLAYSLLCEEGDPNQPSPIARSLQKRFDHVLVDEFQDINPLQQAIITLLSRESDPQQADNLFVVGDVKQSIYRFRLAEPTLFTQRQQRFETAPQNGVAIYLKQNFRSRPEILEAVNLLFTTLMREGVGQVVYDDSAQLMAGKEFPPGTHEPVEIHLLDRTVAHVGDADLDPDLDLNPDQGEASDSQDNQICSSHTWDKPHRWSNIEREAYAIAQRIHEMINSDYRLLNDQPVTFQDMVILLRTKKVNAEKVATMLNALGIPAHADQGGSLFATREVRDVMAALQIFDNPLQDIPLAGVLRSGMLGEPFSEDELVELRCLNRQTAFHQIVRDYAQRGPQEALRHRLKTLFNTIERYRTDVRRRPLADTLWKLLDQEGYLAYASGLTLGFQRRANLLKLHELTRKFGTFERQGLPRFLRFVDALADGQEQIASAPNVSEAENVVRVMSIHQSKGLEFPVVFLAGLGGKMNLGDRTGRIIFERKAKIGLRVVDREKMIEYPTLAHRRVVDEVDQVTREEELRVLYVAMTRAREKLILIGSCAKVEQEVRCLADSSRAVQPSLFQITNATTPLDWLIPALSHLDSERIQPFDANKGVSTLFRYRTYGSDEMSTWRVHQPERDDSKALRLAVAQAAPLPAKEPQSPDDSEVQAIETRLDYLYPHLSCTSVPATVAAGAIKQAYDFLNNPQESPHTRSTLFPKVSQQGTRTTQTPLAPSSRDRGVLTHRVLEKIDYQIAVDPISLDCEIDRLIGQKMIDSQEVSLLDRESIAWFLSTDLAKRIRLAGNTFRRELMFLTTEPLAMLDDSLVASSDDRVLVKGVVDGALLTDMGVEVIDFKTDAIAEQDVLGRAKHYHAQMQTYCRAVSRLYKQPVKTCWLVFLTPRVCHEVINIDQIAC